MAESDANSFFQPPAALTSPGTPPRGQSPLLLEEEFAPHYHAWAADPSGPAAGQLLKTVDPVVRSALRTYAGGSAASPTLRSRAKLIVLDSLPRYDPARAKLRTHLMVNLQSLRRATAEEHQIANVPERIRLDSHRLQSATAELSDRLGRDPSDGELAAHAGLSLRRLAHVRKSQPGMAEGQLEGGGAEGGPEPAGAAAPAVVARTGSDTWLRFVHHDLSPTDQFIMERAMGLFGHRPMPKGEIARRLGISAGAVSQRAAKIQKLLDRDAGVAAALQ